jgi:hypothetical protein
VIIGNLLDFNFNITVFLSWSETESTWYCGHCVWSIVPAPGGGGGDDDDDECGAIGGMRIDRGTEVLAENLPLCQFVQHKSHMT